MGRTNCELVSVQTSDLLRLDGALWRAEPQSDRPLDALIFVHGVGSNFYQSSIVKKIIPTLHDAGISLFSVNTRGHDFAFSGGSASQQPWLGSAFELVSDCTLDLPSWIEKSRKMGFEKIGLLGHSLGAIKTIYSQALADSQDLTALIAASPSCLSHSYFIQSNRSAEFKECLSWAQTEIDAGNSSVVSEVSFPFRLLMTPRTFVDKYGAAENYNILKYLDKIETPLLLTFGEAELRSGNPAFQDLDHRVQPLIQNKSNIELRLFADGDHFYSGLQTEFAKAIVNWLSQ